MGRVLRSSAAVLAALALVALLPAPCRCPEPAAAPRTGHECCAPPPGVSASDHACCNEGPSTGETVASPAGADAPMPDLAILSPAAAAPAARLVARVAAPSPSPPIPLVLRI